MATEKFIRAEAAKQTAFGTAASANQFAVPFTGEYTDAQEEHSATWDRGTWTPTEIVAKVADFVTFTTEGVAFFELLPVQLNAGFGHITVSGADPYIYDGVVSPTAVGTPRPYTWWFGSRENIGGTGPAVKVQDAYLQELVLTGNINSKEVAQRATWFGLKADDNSGAGYAMADAALPSPLGMLRTLLGAFDLKDAATTGGSFATMTNIDGYLLDWALTMRTGVNPAWRADSNQQTYTGIQFTEPEVIFTCNIVCDATRYALVRTKFDARTYQELMLTLNGDASRQVKWKLTGRWTDVPRHTGRAEGQMVLPVTFTARTPHTQVTTPHYFGWELDTKWSH